MTVTPAIPGPDLPRLDPDRLGEIAARHLSGNDAAFFGRCWATPPSLYQARLRAVDLQDRGRVLDAGSGMGQWLIPLASLNQEVHAIEFAENRVAVTREVLDALGLADRIHLRQGSVETLPYPDGWFDGIFSYSVVPVTDVRRTLAEFFRVLAPGGTCYFNTNGLGWYLHNIIDGHNPAEDFSPRQMAIDTLANSLAYFATGVHVPGRSICTSLEVTRQLCEDAGFTIVASGGEGTVNLTGEPDLRSFFPGSYHGEDGVFELVVRRPA